MRASSCSIAATSRSSSGAGTAASARAVRITRGMDATAAADQLRVTSEESLPEFAELLPAAVAERWNLHCNLLTVGAEGNFKSVHSPCAAASPPWPCPYRVQPRDFLSVTFGTPCCFTQGLSSIETNTRVPAFRDCSVATSKDRAGGAWRSFSNRHFARLLDSSSASAVH
jgi:hypothetical protein